MSLLSEKRFASLGKFNPHVPNAPFLYPLRISQNHRVLWCFQRIEKGCTANEWAKLTKYNPGDQFTSKVSQGESSFYLSEGIIVRILIRILLTDKNRYTYFNEEVDCLYFERFVNLILIHSFSMHPFHYPLKTSENRKDFWFFLKLVFTPCKAEQPL